MRTPLDYSDIASIQDTEVKAVLEDLKKNPSFLELLHFMNLDNSPTQVERLLSGIDSIEAFQKRISHPWLSQFLEKTTSDITCSGFEYLCSKQKTLFISNHRDIILDSAILNVLLINHNLPTVETAIGNNLLKSDIVRILTKLNKNFTVQREGSAREKYATSLILSAYIRTRITDENSSVWLAQREGRAKDGNDTTQQGLLKMLNLSNEEASFEEGFQALHIHPMSLSYEYDPCDRFKLKELLAKLEGRTYVKEKDEDFHSIVTGILGKKGRVHLSIQPMLKQEINALKPIKTVNEKTNHLAQIIDQSIYQSYKLFENNYIAFDLLHNTRRWESQYSNIEKAAFEAYLQEICVHQKPIAKKLLLKKYAFPLINATSDLLKKKAYTDIYHNLG